MWLIVSQEEEEATAIWCVHVLCSFELFSRRAYTIHAVVDVECATVVQSKDDDDSVGVNALWKFTIHFAAFDRDLKNGNWESF